MDKPKISRALIPVKIRKEMAILPGCLLACEALDETTLLVKESVNGKPMSDLGQLMIPLGVVREMNMGDRIKLKFFEARGRDLIFKVVESDHNSVTDTQEKSGLGEITKAITEIAAANTEIFLAYSPMVSARDLKDKKLPELPGTNPSIVSKPTESSRGFVSDVDRNNLLSDPKSKQAAVSKLKSVIKEIESSDGSRINLSVSWSVIAEVVKIPATVLKINTRDGKDVYRYRIRLRELGPEDVAKKDRKAEDIDLHIDGDLLVASEVIRLRRSDMEVVYITPY